MNKELSACWLPVCLVFLSAGVYAQQPGKNINNAIPADIKKISLGINLEPILPIEKFKQVSDFGYAINIMGTCPVWNKLEVRGSFGYMLIHFKSYSSVDGSGNIVAIKHPPLRAAPLRVGLDYFIIGKLFVNGSVGVAMLDSGGGNVFFFSAGTGIKKTQWEGLIKYEDWSLLGSGNLPFLSLQLGFYFK